MCNELFADWTLEQACRRCAELGYAGLELAPFTLAPQGLDRAAPGLLRQARRTAAACGLELIGLHWLLVGPQGLHLTSPDAAVRRRTAGYLCTLVEGCAEMGGRLLVLGSPKQRSLAPGQARAVERAAAAGLRWCLEPLPAVDTNFLNTLQECLELDRLLGGGPALGVQLDAKSLCAEAADPRRPEGPVLAHAADAGRFAHLHANDRNLGAPGSGDVDFGPLFAALRQVGYAGWTSVEVFDTRAGAEAIARDSLAYLRSALGAP